MTVQFALPAASRRLPPPDLLSSPFGEDGVTDGPALRFEQDCEIYGEGEDADCCYKVVSGVVRTCKFLSDGRRQIDAFHVAGDLFGIETGGLRGLSAEAVTECRIAACRIPPLGESDAEPVPPQLLVQVLRDLNRAQEHAVLLGRRSAVEKVAAFLLDWARRSAVAGSIALAMTRQDIGDYLGLTIETVSRTLSLLERGGIIELPAARQIRIRNTEALARLNG